MNKNYRIFLEARSITLVAFFICVVTTGCVPSKVVVSLKKNNVVEPLSINISNVQVVNHQIIITGTNLNTVTNFKIKEGSSNTNLQIESKNNNSIVANTISNVTFAAGRVFDFILSNASGASTFTVDFSLCDSQLGGKGFNCSITPTDKQVLSYDLGTGKWRPRSVNGLNYQGTWSALTALPATGVLIPGDYYIVSVANAPYNVGDWIVLNADGITFEQIQNVAIVTTVFGRNGNVVATENDYILDKMGDVDLSTPPILGDALVYDGSHWVAGAVNGGGAPSGAAGGDLAGTYPNPTIGNNKITDAHIANSAISQTKVNGLATSLAGKESSITAAATTTYYRGDKTFVTLNSTVVPEGSNLYFTNARALGILLTGFDNTLTGQVAATDSMLQAFGRVQNQINSLSSGGSNYLIKNGPDTLSGAISLTNVITATGAGDVVVNSVPLTMTSAINKTYADGKLDKTTGGTIAGVVTLDNDLKVKAGSNYVTVKGNAATAADYNFVLPVNAGTAGYLLSTDGAGNTSWITAGGGGAPTGAAGGDLSGNYPNPTITGLDAAKVGGGAVSNAEFAYLDGVTSAIQTQLNNKQGLDATLTALTAYNTNGFIVQTAVDTFAGRSVTGTSNRVSVTNGDGVAGNPSVNVSTTLLPSPVVGDIGKFLKATAADTSVWSALGLSDITTALGFTPINKAGDSITSGIFTLSGTAVLRTPDPVGLTDVANKQYVDNADALKVTKAGDTMSGVLTLDNNLKIKAGANYVTVRGNAATAADYNFVLPVSAGTAGYVLSTDGAGNTSWASAGMPANAITIYKARVATTGNITLSATQTIDDVAVVAGDRVLVKNQSTQSENGVYVVSAGAWARATDLDTWAEAVGYHVQVSEGSMWDGMSFVSRAESSGTLDTTSLSWAGNGETMGSENTVNGYEALNSNTSGYQNIAIGSYSLINNTTGIRNTATGYSSLVNNVVGDHNTATGYQTLRYNTASFNTAYGSRSLYSNTTGQENTAIGLNSGTATTTGSFNLFAGAYSGESNTTGIDNTFLGYLSGQGNTIGYDNTTVGAYAGLSTTTGNRNTYIGANSGDNNQTGSKNVGLGSSTLGFFFSTGDAYNTAIGFAALEGASGVSNGLRNTALGGLAGTGLTTGNNNLLIGYNSGSVLTTGSNNVILGSNTGSTIATLSNNILISDGAGTERARIDSSGFFGINTTAPGSSLDVKGTLRLSGSTSGYVGFAPAAAAGSTTYTLPIADGTAGQLLKTNGSGVLSWVTDSTGGGAFSGTASRAVATDGAGALTTVTTTATELGYVNGVTSSIQTQLNAKEPTITAGSAAQYLKGDKSLGTFLTDVMNSLLTGVSFATNSAILAGDNLLVALGKLQAQVSALTTSAANYLVKNGTDAISGTVNVTGTMNVTTGFLTITNPPATLTDAANKQYVDTFGKWTISGSDVYRASGNVGIGTTPTSTLNVNGAIVSNSVSNTVAYIDFGAGNVQVSTTAATTINVCDMKDGGSYTLVLTGVAASTLVTVNAYSTYVSTSSCTGALQVDLGTNEVTQFTTGSNGTTNIVSFVYVASRAVYGVPAVNYTK